MNNKCVLVTGSQGFIGSYICGELLLHNYQVIGIDNYSKYGRVTRHQDTHANFELYIGDVKDILISKAFKCVAPDYMICLAAMIGGISYFHQYAYDLLAENERILASSFDYAIDQYKKGILKRLINVSSSMVFEVTNVFPTPESEIGKCPPPYSTYGMQKLMSEYFCKGAHKQYGLPYTIVRPFNCVGVGEDEAILDSGMSVGNVKIMTSHVLPDFVNRALELGPNKSFPILGSGKQIRCYTNGKDIAKAIRVILETDNAVNEDFNISSPVSTSVKELAVLVYKLLFGITKVKFEHLKPFQYDVQKRIPDVSKAKKLLNIICDTPLEISVREVIDWMKGKRDVSQRN